MPKECMIQQRIFNTGFNINFLLKLTSCNVKTYISGTKKMVDDWSNKVKLITFLVYVGIASPSDMNS